MNLSDMSGRVVLLTGGTSGIGRAAAQMLAERGATLVITGRSRVRGERVVSELSERTGAEISLLIADFAEQSEVRRLAREFRAKRGRLDVLVHNAGTYCPKRRVTSDGIEETLAVNHLAPFLLTHEIVDLLNEGDSARVVVVSSGLHKRGHIHFDDLQFERSYDTQRAYAQSKLANLLFTYELADRLDGTGVTANALHPGVIPSTRLGRDSDLWSNLIYRFIGSLPGVGTTIEEGASITAYLAASPDIESVNGSYYTVGRTGLDEIRRNIGIYSHDTQSKTHVNEEPNSEPKLIESSPESENEMIQRRLWEVSADLVGVAPELPIGSTE
jgi:NAD(P)-dependent dehydrogenase (short-subunit alcohol dehydrogenase family)